MNNKPLVYSGRKSISLFRKLLEEKSDIQSGLLRVRNFADAEIYYRVEDYQIIPGRNVYVIQSTSEYAPTTYFDLFGLINAVKRQNPKRLIVIMPFMGFRRQERDATGGEAVMAEVMAKFIVTLGADDVVLCDPHAPAIRRFFEQHIKVHLIDPNPIFAEVFKDKDMSNYIVLTPDTGRTTAAENLANLLKIPLVKAKKQRADHDQSESLGVDKPEEVRGKHVIIRDDEISTGGTVINTAKKVKIAGGLDVTVMATHGVLVGESIWNIMASTDIVNLYITDSIYLPWEKRADKIIVLSLALSIAKIIQKIEEE